MIIEKYSGKHDDQITALVEAFHREALSEYDKDFDRAAFLGTIENLKKTQADNAYLLIIDGKCEGIIAGIEIKSLFNNNRMYQELIWYVSEPYRRYGVLMFKKVQADLLSRGFSAIVMAVMENSKTDKIKHFYERIGFKNFETHYIKNL